MATGLDEMRKLIGLQEVRDNKQIRAYLHTYSVNHDIDIDPAQISWCAAIMGATQRAAGNPGTGRLNARSYLQYGHSVPQDQAQEGDIVVFDFEHDGVHGHVTYFVNWNDGANTVTCIGGNQHNSVNSSNYIQDYIVDIRRFP